jgi:hypothetical protein
MTDTDKTEAQAAIDALLTDPAVRRRQWADIARQGVVIELHIGYWRPWARLDPADLGLPSLTKAQATSMKLGSKALVTNEWLDKLLIEGVARRTLARFSLEIAGRRFVPVTAYATWREQNEAIKASFFKVRDQMIARWDDILRDAQIVYEVAASDAWPTAVAINPELAVAGRLAFMENYVGRIMSQMPSQTYVRDSFTFTASLTYIEGGPTNVGDTGLKILDDDIRAEAERRQVELADNFVAGVLGELNTIVYDVALGVLSNVERGGRMTPGDTKAMRAMIDRSPLLNFMNDPELAAMIAEIRRIADMESGDRDMGLVANIMRNVCVIGRRRLVDLGRDVSSARTLGVPDSPDDVAVRGARLSLNLIAEADLSLPVRTGRIGPDDEGIFDLPVLTRTGR